MDKKFLEASQIKDRGRVEEKRLSSREVAPMMDLKQHSDLLRKIDSINVDFRESKIAFSKYWIESTYKVEGQTREYREFLISKKGCEFLAHKTTGTKGNLFTDKYMGRFEKMENHIKEEKLKSKISNDVIIEALKNILEEHEVIKKELKEKTALINQINNCISNVTFPVKQKVGMSENAFRNLIVEFMNENDVVLKGHKQGVAIDKDALYEYMAQYGWAQHDVLKALDEYNMIYHSGENKTQRVRLNGKIIRALIIQ